MYLARKDPLVEWSPTIRSTWMRNDISSLLKIPSIRVCPILGFEPLDTTKGVDEMKSKPLFPRDYVAPRWIDPIALQINPRKQRLLYKALLHFSQEEEE